MANQFEFFFSAASRTPRTIGTSELSSVAEVVARNLETNKVGYNPNVSKISRSDVDELWRLAVDAGTALSQRDCAAINAFHKEGGGLLTARDHQNMGMWLRQIDGVGAAHFFHEPKYCEPDESRLYPDDLETPNISWPNYHSGRNGDLQRIIAIAPPHPLLLKEGSSTECIRLFPAHPHEGAIGVPRTSRALAPLLAAGVPPLAANL